MTNPSPWLQAARLRTLPLAIGAITMGAFAANMDGVFKWDIYLLCILTAVLLQVLSNFANDYGDFKKGTDNEQRVGPKRALQSGIITEKAMLRAVVVFSVLSLSSGIVLIWLSLRDFSDWRMLLMLLFGIAAVAAAIKYTVGKNAYGYSGWGDVFVFIFFGLMAVTGTYFLMGHTLTWMTLLPAICFGCLSAGVLNINNIRDIENDKASNKITVAVKLGRNKAKIYQTVLMLVAAKTIFWYLWGSSIWIFLLSAVLFIPILVSFLRVLNNKPGEEPLLNRELKSLSLGSALLSVGIFAASFFVK